jgi:methyl-accepting chemotaxis protein
MAASAGKAGMGFAVVAEVNELMDEIAAASQEQAQGVERVNKGMTQIETHH